MSSKCLICVHLHGLCLKFSVLDLGSHVSGFSWLTSGRLPHTIRSLNEHASINNRVSGNREGGRQSRLKVWSCDENFAKSVRHIRGVVSQSYNPSVREDRYEVKANPGMRMRGRSQVPHSRLRRHACCVLSEARKSLG